MKHEDSSPDEQKIKITRIVTLESTRNGTNSYSDLDIDDVPDTIFMAWGEGFEKIPKEQLSDIGKSIAFICSKTMDTRPLLNQLKRTINDREYFFGIPEIHREVVLYRLIGYRMEYRQTIEETGLDIRLDDTEDIQRKIDIVDGEMKLIAIRVNNGLLDTASKEEKYFTLGYHQREADRMLGPQARFGYRQSPDSERRGLTLFSVVHMAEGATAYEMKRYLRKKLSALETQLKCDLQNEISKNNYQSSFSDLFYIPSDAKKSLKVLQLVDPQIIDNNDHYLLGDRGKGAITAWLELLFRKHIIKKTPDDIMAASLNTTLKNFKISGKTLRSPGTKAYKKYKTDLEYLISREFS